MPWLKVRSVTAPVRAPANPPWAVIDIITGERISPTTLSAGGRSKLNVKLGRKSNSLWPAIMEVKFGKIVTESDGNKTSCPVGTSSQKDPNYTQV